MNTSSSEKFLNQNFRIIGPKRIDGVKVTGAQIVKMVMAYIEKLKKINPKVNLAHELIGVRLDTTSLSHIVHTTIGNTNIDEVLALFGVENSSGSDKNTTILLPRFKGNFIIDENDKSNYIAYETWDPFNMLYANASEDDLQTFLVVKQKP